MQHTPTAPEWLAVVLTWGLLPILDLGYAAYRWWTESYAARARLVHT